MVWKEGVALSPLLFNFTLEYTLEKVQEIWMRLKLNGTYQLLFYANVNLMEDNVNTLKNTEVPTDTSKGLA
jgi:hypothetical protein